MSEELRKAKQQETEVQQDVVELEEDELDQVSGGVGRVVNSTDKKSRGKQKIEMPLIKL